MRPGRAPAAPTSRPVVIGHKPGAQQAQLQVSGIGAPGNLMDSRKKIEVKPSATSAPDNTHKEPAKPENKPETKSESKPEAKNVSAAAPSRPSAIPAAVASKPLRAAPLPTTPATTPVSAPASVKNNSDQLAVADDDDISAPAMFTDSSSWADALADDVQPDDTPAARAANAQPADARRSDTQLAGAQPADAASDTAKNTPPNSEPAASAAAYDPDPANMHIPENKLDEAAIDPEPKQPEPIPYGGSPAQQPSQDDVPPLNEMPVPSLDGQVIVSPHTTEPSGAGKIVALVSAIILFAIVILDILLDAGIINSSAIPHTNFF